jgi:hypothetical protein
MLHLSVEATMAEDRGKPFSVRPTRTQRDDVVLAAEVLDQTDSEFVRVAIAERLERLRADPEFRAKVLAYKQRSDAALERLTT